jgi:SAM-dependent methyltransferase
MSLDPRIAWYYGLAPEESRLEQGVFRLEAERTRELLERHLPAAPTTVLDVGGAAGAYAFWLAEQGHNVHLIDATPRLVDEARKRSERAPHPLASCSVGDARNLDFRDECASVVLLLGPLYHLVEATGRRRALEEAARVLRPGGLMVAAAISRWASALDGLARELFLDPAFLDVVDRDVREGQHRNPTEKLAWFTTAYFHRPENLRAEVTQAGFEVLGLYGIEGPGWMFADFDERWADPQRREFMLRVARQLEEEPSMLGCSPHLLVVGQKA